METSDIRTICTRYGTFAIDTVRDEKMTRALEDGRYPSKDAIAVARAFVNERSVVIDIGAHIGTFTVPIAKVVEKTIAFEPSLPAADLLSRNAQENDVMVRVVNKALGSEKGSGTLVVRNVSNAGANTLVPGGDISITTLDEDVPYADFIKIDVEGMELEVLKGGSQLIERARPAVFFEVNLSQLRAHGTSPRALGRFFTKRGYRLYVPFERKGFSLARVWSATLLTALIAPRAWLFFDDSAPFDLVAVPYERALPLSQVGFLPVAWQVISNNIVIKTKRVIAFFK